MREQARLACSCRKTASSLSAMDKDAKNDVVAPSSKRARDNSVARSAVSKRRRRRASDGGNQDKPLASLSQQLAGGTVDRPRQVGKKLKKVLKRIRQGSQEMLPSESVLTAYEQKYGEEVSRVPSQQCPLHRNRVRSPSRR